jgi:hypothetical protein
MAPDTMEVVEQMLAAAPAPKPDPTPPSGGRKPKITTKHVDLEAGTMKVHDEQTPEGREVKWRSEEAAELPSFASELHEESAPPRKYVAKYRREDRKHRAIGSAKQWLRDCTDRVDGGVTLPATEAWRSYLAWCASENMKHLPQARFEPTISKLVGSISVNGKKHFTNLVLAVATEKLRAVA